MKENIYSLYCETRNKDFRDVWNGQTMQCDGLTELIYQLRQMIENKEVRNIIIHTIQNGKPQN